MRREMIVEAQKRAEVEQQLTAEIEALRKAEAEQIKRIEVATTSLRTRDEARKAAEARGPSSR